MMRRRVRCFDIDRLEPRLLLATFTVTNTDNAGDGSLRKAIADANAAPAEDFIVFDIPGPGVHVISPKPTNPNDPTSVAMPITDTVYIDAYTQPGASANTLAVGNNATILVRLDGSDAGAGVAGVFVDSTHNVLVSGLSITNFEDGVIFRGGGSNLVAGCFIGLDPAGNAAGNRGYGVSIEGSSDDRVGRSSVDGHCVVSANRLGGVRLTGSASINNIVQGSYIGTDPTGTAGRGNGGNGIEVTAFDPAQGYASHTLVGPVIAGGFNVISGNAGNGVALIGALAGQNTVRGNFIGTDATGTVALPNGLNGVDITFPLGTDGRPLADASSNNFIGGAAPGAGNVISGNGANGVRIAGPAQGNLIQGNFIGTDVTGTRDLGNLSNGVRLRDAADVGAQGPVFNVVGGSLAGEGNLISGNDGSGIEITGLTTGHNLVQGNLIGTQADGATGLPNLSHGVFLDNLTSDNVVGDADAAGVAAARNVIAFNGRNGVTVTSGTRNAVRPTPSSPTPAAASTSATTRSPPTTPATATPAPTTSRTTRSSPASRSQAIKRPSTGHSTATPTSPTRSTCFPTPSPTRPATARAGCSCGRAP